MERPQYYEPKPGQGGMTDLMHFARWANVAGVKKEIQRGANINAIDDSKLTALLWNCRMGHPREYRRRKRIFWLLAKAGASLQAKDGNGWNALATAKYFAPRPLRRFVVAEYARLRRNDT